MQALQRSSRIATGLWGKSLAKPQIVAPALTRNLTEEQKKKRDAWREKMQYPDDTPVFLRGGPLDKVLFGVSCITVACLTMFTFYRVYTRATA